MESQLISQKIAELKQASLKSGEGHKLFKATDIIEVPRELIGRYIVKGDRDSGEISLSAYSLVDGYSKEKYSYGNGLISGGQFEVRDGKIVAATAGPNNDSVNTLIPVELDKHADEDLFIHLDDLKDYTYKSDKQ